MGLKPVTVVGVGSCTALVGVTLVHLLPPLQRLLFEATDGQTDRLVRLLDKCQQVGVSLRQC